MSGQPWPGVRRWLARAVARGAAASLLVILCSGAAAAGLGGWFAWSRYTADLPDVAALRNYTPSLVTRLLDDKGRLAAEYYVERRVVLPFDRIPPLVRQATIAVEDAAFYEHHGLNLEGIVRAMLANLRAGRVVQGGSSITQQVAKTLLLTPERTLERKIKEAILSIQIDRAYSKNEILEIYLNHIYYGHGAYGVEAAARTYFGKGADKLSISEVAMLAGLPKAPNNYSPYRFPERALERRSHALARMEAIGAITPEQQEAAETEPFTLAGLTEPLNNAPWFAEQVRRYLEKAYGAQALYHEGLTVHTTLDLDLQKYADEAARTGLELADQRLGYRGPVAHVNLGKGELPGWAALNPPRKRTETFADYYKPGARLKALARGVVKERVLVEFEDAKGAIELADMAWAHPVDPERDALYLPEVNDAREVIKAGDVVEVEIKEYRASRKDPLLPLKLFQTPQIQGALLAVDPRTGYVRAMVGGYDPKVTKFNRAVQAQRQPGSSFKPVIYTAALDHGFTPSSVVVDSPIIYNEALNEFRGWKPVNFEEKFFGPTTIREAVTHSRNVVTIKVLSHIGVRRAQEYARKLGLTSPLEMNLSMALGSSPVTLKELVYAYATLANGGTRMAPVFIKSVETREGKVLEKTDPAGEVVIAPSTAYLMTNIMKSVIEEGTARRVGAQMSRPIAGKTGTTNNYVDAWFIGFTPDLVCGVWVGKDDNTPLGRRETGSRAAIPLWMEFMDHAMEGTPVTDFIPPPDIVFARVNKYTGAPARGAGEETIFESFRDGEQPAMPPAGSAEKSPERRVGAGY